MTDTTNTTDAHRPSTETAVLVGRLRRVRQRQRVGFVAEPAPVAVHRPARIAIMVALAHKIRHALDRGDVEDQAEVARRLGCARARITQLLDLTLLAPAIQEALLALEAVDGVEPVAERVLRGLIRVSSWEAQWARWCELGLVVGRRASSP